MERRDQQGLLVGVSSDLSIQEANYFVNEKVSPLKPRGQNLFQCLVATTVFVIGTVVAVWLGNIQNGSSK